MLSDIRRDDSDSKANKRRATFLYVTESDLSIDNGPGINEREFVSALLEHEGSEVVCIAPYPKKPSVHFDFRIKYVKYYHKGESRLYWPLYCFYLVSSFTKIISLHRKRRFSAFIFRLGRIPIAPFLLSKFTNVPLILKTLARYQMFSETQKSKPRIRNKILLPLYKATIRKALISDTVSSNYIEWLRFKFGVPKDRLFLVTNGANTRFFFPGNRDVARRKVGLNDYEWIIGYVGVIGNLRHVRVLIGSFKQISRGRNVGLVLVGDGHDRGALEALVKKENIENKVKFVGKVPYSKVPIYLQAFDVAMDLTVVPMDVGGETLAASYSQKIPQYLACGLPVIAWDTRDTEFLKNEKIGEVVSLGNKDGVAKSMAKFMDLYDVEREQMRSRARSYAEQHFEISKLVSRRMDIWKKALFSDERIPD